MESSILNETLFSELQSLDETGSFIQDILKSVMNQIDQEIEKLKQTALSGDITLFNNRSHFLKGSTSSLGLQFIADLCMTMQHYQPSAESTEDTQHTMLSFIVELKRRKEVTKHYIRTNKGIPLD